jgi:hypothetical protein
MKKHVATYPIYATAPVTLKVTRRRVGTGFIYSWAQLVAIREELAKRNHPLHVRWRNEECRRAALSEARERDVDSGRPDRADVL